MIELKFRAWDGEKKFWLNPEHFYVTGQGRAFTCEHSEGMFSNEYRYMGTARYILMQYTGLKDKNGVEIYEGDICKSWWPSYRGGGLKSSNLTVEYSAPAFTFSDGYRSANLLDIEVIGNIYENKNLLDSSS